MANPYHRRDILLKLNDNCALSVRRYLEFEKSSDETDFIVVSSVNSSQEIDSIFTELLFISHW